MNSASAKCIVCKKAIEIGAAKCTECDSYQGWTRYIFRYAAVVTAILSMIPAGTIALSLYKIAFDEKSPKIQAALVRCDSRRIDIAIANVGEAPAILSNVSFSSPNTPPPDTPSAAISIRRTGTNSPNSLPIDPGKGAAIVSYEAVIGQTQTSFPAAPGGMGTCKYHITVETVQLDKKTKKLELLCDCVRS